MKKISRFGLLVAFLAISAWGFAQSTIDFETVGNSWTWSTFENNNISNAFTVVANPSATGINTSANCGKIVVDAAGQPYAGAECKHGDFGPYLWSSSNYIVKFMVYKSVISPIGLKFATSAGWAKLELKVSNTKINEWEEITIDFSAYMSDPQPAPFDQIIIFPDFPATRTAGSTSYVDNISFPGATSATINVSTGALTIASPANSTKTFGISTAINWTVASDQTWLTPTPASGTGNGTVTLTATANTSTSARTANVTVTATSDASTKTVVVTQDGAAVVLPAAPTPTVNAAKVISFFSDAYTNVTGINFAPGWGQATVVSDVTPGGNAAKKYTNFDYIGVDFAGNHQNASAMTTLHVDIYPVDETNIRITPISPGPKEFSIVLSPLKPSVWNSYDIPLSSFTGVVMSDLFQFKFDGGTGKTFYMDNLYLYDGSTTAVSKLDKSGISVYPNPVKSSLFVNGLPQNATVNIYDMRGKLVINRQNSDNQIDVNNLAKGIYSIQISGKNGITTKKFVKE